MVRRALIVILLIPSLSCEGLFFDTPDESDPLEIYDKFISKIEEHSPQFPYFNIDIDSVFEINRNRIISNPTGRELTASFQEILNVFEDANMKLITSSDHQRIEIYYSDWLTKKPLNTLLDISNYFETYTAPNRLIEYGMISGVNLGYIKINTFNLGWQVDSLEAVLRYNFKDTNGLVIDIRSTYTEYASSSGNREAEELSSFFSTERKVFLYQRYKFPSGRMDFSEWEPLYTISKPNNSNVAYSRPVVVLTNNQTKDRAEYFAAAMRTISDVQFVGDTTAGYLLGYWFDHVKGNWYMEGSNRDFRLPDEDNSNGFSGIPPDVPVSISTADSMAGRDTILEKAIEILNQ